jgi:dihydroorotate dehydrogenase
MNAAGSLGFAPSPRAPVVVQTLGAFITNPISWRPRTPAEQPALAKFPGGFLLHTGLPNPGLRKVLTAHSRTWAQLPLPVVVHLMADRPEEAELMIRALEELENVMAAELGFAPLLADDLILLTLEKSRGELPLIMNLQGDQLLRLGPRLLDAGAAALSLAPPRGSLATAGGFVSGRLFGPSLLPAVLDLVRAASKLGLPIIAAGAVSSEEDVQAALAAGAMGVQLDFRLWLPHGNEKNPVD